MKTIVACLIGLVALNIWTIAFSIYSLDSVSEIVEKQENSKPALEKRIEYLDEVMKSVKSEEINRTGLLKIFNATKESEIASTNTHISLQKQIDGTIKVIINSIFATILFGVVIVFKLKSLTNCSK